MKNGVEVPTGWRVQVICDTDLEYFRNLILGVREHCFASGRMVLGDRWIAREEDDLGAMVKRDGIDGIIAEARSPEFARRLVELPVPVVNVSHLLGGVGLPLVTADDVGAGGVAARHLLERGCAAFGFWGQRGAAFSEERMKGFCGELEKRAPGAGVFVEEGMSVRKESGAELVEKMARWLEELPRPLGVFAAMDELALHLLRAAQGLGLKVPEEVAILGTGDDEFWVDFESVPLSSVKLPAWEIGRRAGELLEDLMDGKELRKRVVKVPVLEVSARRSTDVVFAGDEAVRRAVEFIRENAARSIYVEDVSRAAGVSRSGLQARFRGALGRSVLAEIQRARVGRVQVFLRTTDLKLTEIAEACDFPDSPRLNVLFKQWTGQTPREYRKVFRRGSR